MVKYYLPKLFSSDAFKNEWEVIVDNGTYTIYDSLLKRQTFEVEPTKELSAFENAKRKAIYEWEQQFQKGYRPEDYANDVYACHLKNRKERENSVQN